LEESEKSSCSVGFCDLCCINSEVIWKVSFDDKVMEACHAECRHVYGSKKEQESLVEWIMTSISANIHYIFNIVIVSGPLDRPYFHTF